MLLLKPRGTHLSWAKQVMFRDPFRKARFCPLSVSARSKSFSRLPGVIRRSRVQISTWSLGCATREQRGAWCKKMSGGGGGDMFISKNGKEPFFNQAHVGRGW